MESDGKLLDEQRLFNEVRAYTGLDDIHVGDLENRLSRLLHHMDAEMDLDDDGRQAAYSTVLEFLITRTGLLEDRQRHPGLAESEVKQPIFVTGLPRSGTTLLHSLLAADPNSRAPEWWESIRPSPPPGLSEGPDPRIELANAEIRSVLALQPGLMKSHPYFDQGSHTLMECEPLAVTDFRHILRTAYYRVPGVVRIELNQDPEAFYQYHRKVLQALQWKRPEKRWALKGTEHHVRLEALKSVYPDAIVIWLHRDPQRVFPSLMEILTSVAEGIAGPVDRPVFGRGVLERYSAMLDRAMGSPLIDHPDVHHLLYADFVRDPIGMVRGVYTSHSIPFGDEQANAMTQWMQDPANRGDRHGKFVYDLESFGVTRDALEDRTAAYRRRFAIPFE